MTKTTHPIVHVVSHRHFIRGFHLSSVGVAIWAVAMVWLTTVSFVGLPASAIGGVTVTGRVLAGSSPVPVGKVQVMIMKQGQPPMTQPAMTDSSGSFALLNVAPDTGYMLQVQVVDATYPYLGKTVQNINVVSNPTSVGDIALTSAPKTLTVTVTRSNTGAGVSGVQVNAFKMGGDFSGGNTNGTTDSAGAVTFHMSGGTWGLNLQAGFGQDGQQVAVDWVYVGAQPQVTFTDDTSAETKTFPLTVQNATATVKGTIKYPDGTAASHIGLNLRNNENAMIQGNTDQLGAFSIKVVAGSYEFSCFLPLDKAQYSCPSAKFSIADNATKDFSTITLGSKSATITGQVTCAGAALANVNVSAFPMQQKEGGEGPGPGNQSFTQTGSDGTYTLHVDSGILGVNAFAQPDTGCVAAAGPPTSVTIADNQAVSGVNFTLIKADVTINGTIKDVSGNPVTNFFGFANAMDASGGGFGPGKQFGGPVQNGTFQIKLPSSAMTKATVTVFPPPQGAQYSVKAPATLDIAANQTYSVTLTVAQNDAALTGTVKDSKGNTISDAAGDVFISNENNSEFHNARIERGVYTLSLLGGTKWHLGYHIQGNYQEQPPSPDLITVPSGQTVTKDITVTATDATIRVSLKDPTGAAVSSGFAFAHEPFDPTKNGPGKEPPKGSGGPVQGGVADIHVVSGTKYAVGAGLPPEFSSNNYMPPEEQTVTPTAGGTSEVTLQFKQSDGSISGSVKMSTGSAANFGFVGCWSDKGSNSGSPVFNGSYKVNLMKSDNWHCRANSFSGADFYDSGEVIVTTGSTTGFSTTQNFTLTKATFTLPQPVSDTVDASQQKIVALSDGTSITIPSGAFGTSGSFTFTATPTVNLTPSVTAKPALGFGYTLSVTDSSGTAVTTFNSAVTVSFPYDPTLLTKLGLLATDLVPKYFDSTTNTWQDIPTATVNTDTHTVTFTTTHFTDFALVTAKSSSASLLKVTTKVKNGLTSFTVNGESVTPFSCKGSVKVGTKSFSGVQYVAAVSTCDGSLKVYDTAASLKKTVKSGWKGINGLALADVTKDSVTDIIIAPVSGKEVKVIDVAKSYAVTAVTLGGSGKWTVAAVDFNSKGTNSLVVAKVANGKAVNFKVFRFSNKKFSTTTSKYSGFLKNANGEISYTLAKPSLTKLSKTTVGKTATKVTITLTGTNFTPDMTVTINSVSVTVSYKSSTSVVITVNGTKLTAGSYALKLTNPGNKSATSKLKVKVQ